MQQFSWRRVVVAAVIAGVTLVAPRIAQAQTGRISGVVTDAQTGQPLEGVQVRVQGTGYGAITQGNGRYFILSVPPGTYTVQARRIGLQTSEVTGVLVRIDVTREVNFRMNPATTVLAVQRVVAPVAPLVERGITGSTQSVSAEAIQSLPTTSIAGVLALQQGFLEVPANTDLVSFSDSRRNVLSPIRIRGGRGGATQTLVDGIPINNVVFGDRAFDLAQYSAEQISFEKGGFEPQYGNALSGIVNIATIEGGTRLKGAVDYQGTGLAGQLGSRPDELLARDIYRGFLSGPIPGTTSKLRFAVSGQLENGADNVYEYDDKVFTYDRAFPTGQTDIPIIQDVFPGWRAGGFDNERQLFGKLTYVPTATSKFSVTAINSRRSRLPYDFDFGLTGFDLLESPAARTLADTIGFGFGQRTYRDVSPASIRADRDLYAGSFSQTFGRTTLQIRGGRFEQERNTCSYFQGICVGSRFSDTNFTGQFVAPGVSTGNPSQGTDLIFGGEAVKSNVGRLDLQSQVTDHHNLQAGLFYQQHDIDYVERRNVGTNDVQVVGQIYRAKPIEAAGYFQDRIEYDFLTVKLGVRYDYGRAKGRGFVNPLNPTNGTTAREVCAGQLSSMGGPTAPYVRTINTPAGDSTFTGVAACGRFESLRDTAANIAAGDDFQDAPARTAFSPRIGVSFPLSETSSLFFNAGRYTQNPLYNNLYQNTGVGTRVGPQDDICSETDRALKETKPNSTECNPVLVADAYAVPFLGNPNLLLEQATQFEMGYAAEFARNYSINVTIYNRNETGLSGIRRSRAAQDIGTTYGGSSVPSYLVIVNQDYATSRGVEVQFRRRLADYWAYDINYSFSKALTNAPPPDRAQEQLQQGDTNSLQEIRSEVDQPHNLRAQLRFQVQDDAPDFRWGNLLRNTNLAVTVRANSGPVYTPIQTFSGFNTAGNTGLGDLNVGTGPAYFAVDLQAGKDVRIANTRYGAYVRVTNLTDRKNCIQVFPTTGRCDAGSVNQRRSRQGNTLPDNTASTFFDRPTFFGARRQIYTGLRASF